MNKGGLQMATSSFSKTFIFDETALKKFRTISEQPGKDASKAAYNRLMEGKEKLAQFSFHSKK